MGETVVTRGPSKKQRLGLALFELVVVGVVWYIMKLDKPLALAIAGAVVVSTLAPPRVSGVVSGVCMLGLAGFVYQYYGHQQLALVLALFGAITLVGGVRRLMSKG